MKSWGSVSWVTGCTLKTIKVASIENTLVGFKNISVDCVSGVEHSQTIK